MVSQYRRLSVFTVFVLLAGLVLAACAGSPSGSTSGKAVDVNITMTDYKYDSSLTTFKQGVTYHFIVKNNGSVAHEIYIMPPDSSQLTADQIASKALAGLGPDVMTPGASATFDYTFTKVYPSGSLELACHLPGHYDAGMHLPIVVQ